MGKDKVVAIVQSRLGSTRLPLKAFLNLHGKPLIDWTLERLAMATRLDGIVVAVPDTEMDALLQKHVEAGGFRCVAGSEDDVLARFVLAAQKANAGKLCASARIIRLSGAKPWTGWLIFMAKILAIMPITTFRAIICGPMAWVPK